MNFLICTVGGSPEPIVASLKHWLPLRAVFLPSVETRGDIEAKILPLLERESGSLDPGGYDVVRRLKRRKETNMVPGLALACHQLAWLWKRP